MNFVDDGNGILSSGALPRGREKGLGFGSHARKILVVWDSAAWISLVLVEDVVWIYDLKIFN